MRAEAASDFYTDVEGVGNFRWARRAMRDELKIAAEFSRLTEGVQTPTDFLLVIAGSIAAIKVLMVSAEPPFDIDVMDPLDNDSYSILVKVHNALREKEKSFRKGAAPPRKE